MLLQILQSIIDWFIDIFWVIIFVSFFIIIPMILLFFFCRAIRDTYRANLAVTRNLARILESGAINIDKQTTKMD